MFIKKYLVILLLFLCKSSFSQNLVFDDLARTPLNCKECKEIVYLFHDSYKKGISINLIDFYPMKALVENCYKNKLKMCGNDVLKQFDLLSGNIEGGPTSYGTDSRWRIPSATDYSKLKISKNDAINNYKKSYNEKLILECSECTEIVEKFYFSYINKSSLNEIEFGALKSKVEECMNQKYADCGGVMEKQLKVLSGNLDGGPTSYGSDSKWRISSKVWKFDSEHKVLTILPSKDAIFSYKKLYGVKDEQGLVFIYPKYKKIQQIKYNNSEYFLVRLGDKEGLMDFSGNIKMPIEFRRIETNELNQNILIFETPDNKRGIVYGDFIEQAIECENLFFNTKFCVIQRNNQYGFVDNFGKIKIEPKYDNTLFIGEKFDFKYFTTSDFRVMSGAGSVDVNYIPSNDVLVVQKNNKFGLVGGLNLEEILPPNYDKIGHNNIATSQCIKGLIPIWKNGKMGYINDKGIVLIAPSYEQILGFGIKGWGNDEVSFVKKDNRWGLFSNKKQIELTPIQYTDIFNSPYGFKVKLNNRFGLIDIDGRELIKPLYDKIIDSTFNTALIVQSNNLFGLVKFDGTILSPVMYQSIESNSGYWNVKRENKIGLLNDFGVVIVQPKYQEIKDFLNANELASIKLNGKYGMINKSGVEIIKPLYDYPILFNNGKSQVSINGKSLIINTDGSVFINNFSNSSLYSLSFNKQSVDVVLDKKFEKMYNDATGKIIYSSALGTKFNYKLFIDSYTTEILKEVESWIGGGLTNNQLKEFYAIRTASENKVTGYLAQLSGFLKANPQLMNESVYGNSDIASNRGSSRETYPVNTKKCTKCSKSWSIYDYDEYNRKFFNERKETRYGFIRCGACQGTKKMSVTAGSNWIGKGCSSCKNTGWQKCDYMH